MNQGLGIEITRDGASLRVAIAPPPPPPVAALMLGKPAAQVAEMLPRLFSLCGTAQGLAVRLALDLPVSGLDPRREILRDHLAKFCLIWPQTLGQTPQALPPGWAEGGAALTGWLWGGARPDDLWAWLGTGQGVAPLLAVIAERFAPGEAVADLPPLTDPLLPIAQENSPAGRVADDPLMQQAEARFGRGPLWRALGRAVDLAALASGAARAEKLAPDTALVTAARGDYVLRARATDGLVTLLERVTPTDHLVAPNGALEQSLRSLPGDKAALAGLVVDILDPCVPVLMKEVADA